MQDNSKSSGGQSAGGSQKPTLSWSQPAASQPSTVKTVAPAPAKTAANTTSSNSNAGTYVGIFVAGIIVGALIGWGITSSNNTGSTATTASSTNVMTDTDSTSTMPMTTGTSAVDLSGSTMGNNGAITVASTQTAGFAVEVSKISVTQPTWLVVYEDHNGIPGNAIGAGLFFAGSNSGTIQLLRATMAGSSYLVGQSVDDGDRTFSITSDKSVRDEKGNAVYTEFTAK